MEKKPAKKNSRKKDQSGRKDFLVVGLGASAGGVKALQEFFAAMPPDSGMVFVVILHLDPYHESNLAQIIQAQTAMRVVPVTKTEKVEPNTVYVIPPNVQLEMVDGVVRPSKPDRPHGERVAVDVFFRTLAEAYERNAVCVVLSGSGSDGTLGLKRIKESNGFAIVQDPEDAEYDSMPRNAINTQLADWVLPVSEMPQKLLGFKKSSERLHLTDEEDGDAFKVAREINADESLREILTILRVRTGHDFSNYKTPTLVRRIARHLQIHELEDIPSYLEFLRRSPDEIQSLLKNLLINVTNFFRDREAFEALQAEILPKIFEGKTGRDIVRVWSCGCASGEEAYSLAVILQEYADTLPEPPRFQVFASDVDDDAISDAREHRYPESIEADVSPERLKKFFVREGAHYRIKKELRETVLFVTHNVLRDPPFSRLDLISCRNLLIYLNRDTQEKVLQIFHFALNKNGYLFLGSSESADGIPNLFAPFDKKQRIYTRRLAPVSQAFVPVLPVAGRWDVRAPERKTERPAGGTTLSDIHYKLLENYAQASILVNQNFDIVFLSGEAGKFLRFVSGEPSRNVLKAVHPDLLPDLRAALFTAQRERQSAEFLDARMMIEGKERSINIVVRVVRDASEAEDFFLVVFEERAAGSAFLKHDEEKISNKDEAMEAIVRRLEEDLQRTKEHLRFTIEQHETTVEELKAANEELQAINEELRSASEELETSKEELQSVNEELVTVNHELKEKMDETGRVYSDLSNLVASTDIATIFLDKSLRIKLYTPPVEQLFNITQVDVGRPLEHFTHHLSYANLPQDAAKVLRSLKSVERETEDNNGNVYLARFVPYRTVDDRIEGVVLNFIDISERKQTEDALRRSQERLQKSINIETVGVIFFDNDIHVVDCNDAFLRMVGFTRREIESGYYSWQKFTPEEFVGPSLRAIEELNTKGYTTPYEKQYIRKDGSRFWAVFSCRRVSETESVEFITDITAQKNAELALRDSEGKYRTLFDSIDEGFVEMEMLMDDAGRVVDWRWIDFNPAFERMSGLKGVKGQLFSEIVPEPEPEWAERYGHVVATGEALRFELPVGGLGKWFDIFVSRIGGEESRRIAVVFNNITERKRREANQNLLFEIGDDLSRLITPDEIMQAVGARLGAALGLTNCVFADVNEERGEITVHHAWSSENVPSLKRTFLIEDYLSPAERAGETVVVRDTERDKRLDAKLYQGLKIGAFVTFPFYRNGRWTANFGVSDAKPRDWRDDEIELFREICDRVFPRIERARAEEALRRSEEKYRTLFDSMDEGVSTLELIFDEDERAVDYIFVEQNAALTKQTGLTSDIIGKRVSEVAPNLEAYWFEAFERVVKTGVPERDEYYIADLNSWFDIYTTRVADSNSRKVICIYNNITERKRREANLSFLAEVSQELAGLTKIDETMSTVGAKIGRFFDVKQCMFAEHADQFETSIVSYGWNEKGARNLKGIYRTRDFLSDEFMRSLMKGEPVVVSETLTDKRVSGESYGALDIRSFIIVPLIREGRWQFQMSIIDDKPRQWTPDEIELLREVTARIWTRFERARAEEAMRESEQQLRALIQNLPGGAVFVLDKNLRYLVAQGEALTTAGFVSEDFIGKTLFEALPPEVAADYETHYRAVLAGEKFEHQHDSHERAYLSRGVPLMNEDGEIYAALVVSFDITDRRRAEEELRKSEEQFNLLLESVEDYAIIAFDIEGRITRWNTGAERIFGWTEAEAVGQMTHLIFTPEDRAAGVAEKELTVALATGRAEDERWHVRKDGSRFYATGVMQVLRELEPEGFVKICRDQTVRLAAEQAAQEKQILSRLVIAQEEERRRIARDIHDHFGQLLTALRLNLDAAKKACGDNEDLRTMIGEAEKRAAELDSNADLIAWELRPAALDDFGLRAALAIYVREWSKHTKIKAELHVAGLRKTRLAYEIETNLYRIAQEALNNIYKHAQAQNVSVLLEKAGDKVSLIIEDDGIGFNPRNKATRHKGLGLMGMLERARICGGELEIESAKGKGTTVYARVSLKK